MTQGFAGSVIAREATVEQAIVRTMIAQRVTVTRPTGVLVMIAAKVEGEVRPLLDWRGALAAGCAIGLVSAAGEGAARAALGRRRVTRPGRLPGDLARFDLRRGEHASLGCGCLALRDRSRCSLTTSSGDPSTTM